MYKIRDIKRVLWLMTVMGVWVSLMGSALGAENAQSMTTINDGMRPVEIEDGVMLLELADGKFMTDNETTVLIGRYKIGNEVKATKFLDAKGSKIDDDLLKPQQRVKVTGFKVSRTTVFAETVQVVKDKYLKKDYRSIRGLSPIKEQ